MADLNLAPPPPTKVAVNQAPPAPIYPTTVPAYVPPPAASYPHDVTAGQQPSAVPLFSVPNQTQPQYPSNPPNFNINPTQMPLPIVSNSILYHNN